MQEKTLHRNFFQRLLGLCATKLPVNNNCWKFEDGKIFVSLNDAPELSEEGGALRLEGKNVPLRVIVVRGDNEKYRAIKNHCSHGKRRLDPIPGTQQVQCCSVGKSIFDYDGKLVSGSAKENIDSYNVLVEDGKLVITL